MQKIFSFTLCYLLSFMLCYGQEINRNEIIEIDEIHYTKSGERYTGKIISYYDDGVLLQTVDCVNGKLGGEYKLFFHNGLLKRHANYNKNSLLDGSYNEYYESGKLMYSKIYENGKLQGLAKSYFESGALQSETLFKDDSTVSRKTFYEDGRLRYEAHYDKSKILYEKIYK